MMAVSFCALTCHNSIPVHPPPCFLAPMSFSTFFIRQHEAHTKKIHHVFSLLLLNQNDCRQDMRLWEQLRDLLGEPSSATREFLGKRVYFDAFVAMVAQMYPRHFGWFMEVHCSQDEFPVPEKRFLNERRGYRQPCALLRTLFQWFLAAEKKAHQLDATDLAEVGEEVCCPSPKRRRVRFAETHEVLGESDSNSSSNSEIDV